MRIGKIFAVNSVAASELVDKLIDKGEAGLYYFSPTIETAKQCLSYCVYHERDRDGLNLWYGLAWEKEIGRNSPLTELKPVRTLKKYLQSAEFKSTEWCLGYKIISQHEAFEDFLAAAAKDRDSMCQQIGDVFLPFVQDTAMLVEEAIQAVLEEAKH